MKILNVAYAAIAVACLSFPAFAQDRIAVSASVRYSDLNLSSESGRAALKARVRRVAEFNCPDMAGSLVEKADSQRCRREMMKDGEQQVARLTTSGQQVALAAPR